MSWGASDIVRGLELALTIYRLGFVEENAADRRYQEFREDINSFQSLLRKLNQSLKEAQRRYTFRGPSLGQNALNPVSEEFENERKAIVGPFFRTLKECEELLDTNKALRAEAGRRSSPRQNLWWHLSQQDQRVDDLRRRLQFHSEKIRFVLDRLSLELLTEADARADDLSAIAEQNLAVSGDILLELNRFRSSLFGFLAGQARLEDLSLDSPHVAGAAVAAKFHQSLSIDAPRDATSDIPLVQGFDALLLHFQQSVSSADQTPENYLLFLKTRWLLNHIKDSGEYQAARPGLYYKRAVNQIERAILARARRPADLVVQDEHMLLGLPESCFRVWPSPPVIAGKRSRQLDQLMPRGNEQKVARIELARDESHKSASVTIFRKSDHQFRVVQEIVQGVDSSLPDQKVIISQQIDTSQDRMIPRYALPTLENPCLEMAIFSRHEENLYSFSSLQDLWKFQTAFIGYEVSFDHAASNIQCQFSDQVKFLDCEGRVQLWQDPIAVSAVTEDGSIGPSGSSTSLSGGSHSRRGSLVTSIAPTSSMNRTSDGWQFGPPKMSAITLLSQLTENRTKRFAVIFMELLPGVYVRSEECKCHLDYDKCSKLVLAGPDRRKLPLRICYSNADFNGQPDPNTFDVFPFRLPQGSDFRNMPVKHTEYVVLKFKTLEEKRRCHQELRLRFRLRDKQIEDQRKAWEDILHRQTHPERHDRISTQLGARIPPPQTFLSSQRTNPRLGLPDSGPPLADIFAASPRSEAARRQCEHLDPTSLSTSPSTTGSAGTPLSAATSVESSKFGSSPGSNPNAPQSSNATPPRAKSRRIAIRNGIARLSGRESQT